MKVSIAQINPKLGDFQHNKAKIQGFIHRALADESNILILPFGAISGFPQGNLVASQDFRACMKQTLSDLAAETANTKLSVFLEGQEVLAQGEILSDIITENNSMQTKLPIPSLLADPNLDIFVNLGPKIFEKNRSEAYETELQIFANEKKSWIFDVNLAGATDELIFTGLSSIFSPSGKLIARLRFTEEDFITVDLNEEEALSVSPVPSGEEGLKKAIIQGIKNYVAKNGFEKVLVSVSGGIDSALVLTLAVEALGHENVFAIYLPSKFSSKLSQQETIKLCENLKVPLREIPIKTLHKSFEKDLDFLNTGNLVWKENIQARIRGNIVMSIANAENLLVLATGNKSESAMGYCTLYGDTCGSLAPISDLLKTEVRALCSYINFEKKYDLIPENIISRQPSAELRKNQVDEDSLPDYNFLDQVLFLHCEEGLDSKQIIEQLGRQEDVIQIFTLLYKSEYKRKQSATGLKLSKRYFGLDWHIPSTVGLWFNQ